MNNTATYEQVLEQNGSLIYTTTGRSMRPFLRSQEDLVRIETRKTPRFSKYDTVMYRRKSGQYVLHRIVKVCPDSYVICGDNCWRLERGITDGQILGVLTGVIRKGKMQDVDSRDYRFRVKLWYALYVPRAAIFILRDGLEAVWKKLKAGIKRP